MFYTGQYARDMQLFPHDWLYQPWSNFVAVFFTHTQHWLILAAGWSQYKLIMGVIIIKYYQSNNNFDNYSCVVVVAVDCIQVDYINHRDEHWQQSLLLVKHYCWYSQAYSSIGIQLGYVTSHGNEAPLLKVCRSFSPPPCSVWQRDVHGTAAISRPESATTCSPCWLVNNDG